MIAILIGIGFSKQEALKILHITMSLYIHTGAGVDACPGTRIGLLGSACADMLELLGGRMGSPSIKTSLTVHPGRSAVSVNRRSCLIQDTKKTHVFNVQSIATPDGLTAGLFGPCTGIVRVQQR